MLPSFEQEALVSRSYRLQQRLLIRPYDRSAIEELVDIAYEEKNWDACILAIGRSFKLQLPVSGRIYVMYGKSYFRRWNKSGNNQGNLIFNCEFNVIFWLNRLERCCSCL